MKTYYNITQQTKEWFKIKWGKIGGTRSGGLFIKSDTLLIELLSELTEDFRIDESYQSFDMNRGNELEPLARKELSKYTGIDFKEVGWMQSLSNPLLGISPDGIDKSEINMCELKCLGAKAHLRALIKNEIPKEYMPQLIHYFTINPKLEKLYFCSFRPESNIKKLFVKELKRDSLVDIGWTKKGKIKEDRGFGLKEYSRKSPDLRTIKEFSDIANVEAKRLNIECNELIEQLRF